MRKLLILLALLMMATATFAQDDVVGGDETTLRLLVERIFDQRVSYDPSNNAAVYVGEMPPEMEYVIPLPGEATVLGSVVYTGGYDDGAWEIYVDTTVTPDEVMAFYQEGDLPDGFRVPDDMDTFGRPGGGFVPSAGVENFPLCFGEDVSIMVMAQEIEDGSAIFMRIFSEDQMPPFCDEDFNPGEFGGPDTYRLLPNLTPPEGASQRQEGGGGGPDFAESAALLTLQEEMTAEELLDHYSEQLVDQEWELVAEDAAEMGGWSTWTLTADDEDEDPYTGILSIIALPGDEPEFTARITIREAD